MELISTITVGVGGAANITFSNIPQTYTDLLLVHNVRDSAATVDSDLFYTFNGDTANNYTTRRLFATGSSVTSDAQVGTSGMRAALPPGANATSNTFSNGSIYIPNYTGTTAKTASATSVMENNATAGFPALIANIWSGTSAITSITLTVRTAFIQNSSISLYGILKGSGGATVS